MSGGKYNMDAIRKEIQDKIDLDKIANPDEHASTIGRMSAELERMPVKVMIDQVQYLDKQLLPAVKKRGGEKSEDYIFFQGLINSLLWGIMVKERFDRIERMYGHQALHLHIVKQEAALLKKELDKYTTMEDLWLSGSVEHILKGIQRRAEDLLNRQTKK